MPGIYEIRNKVNGKRYIGSTSREFKERWKEHRYELRSGRHHSPHLQHSWDFHGEINFEFTILEEINNWTYEEQILEREQWYFDTYEPEYNCVLTAEYTFPKQRKGKTYTITKDEKNITFSNLAKFCRDNNLKECNLRAVIGGYIPDYQGYHLPNKIIRRGRGSNGVSELARKNSIISNSKTYTFIKDGKIIAVTNLEDFCRKNGLGVSSMRNVNKGRQLSYKGYKVYNEK